MSVAIKQVNNILRFKMNADVGVSSLTPLSGASSIYRIKDGKTGSVDGRSSNPLWIDS